MRKYVHQVKSSPRVRKKPSGEREPKPALALVLVGKS